MQVTTKDVDFFAQVIGAEHVLTNPNDLKNYGKDWTSIFAPNPSVILFPNTTDQVSQIVRYCNEHDLKIVPSGGRTGLAGGAMATRQEVVVSLGRMNRIVHFDPRAMVAILEAGVTTQTLQEKALDAGVFFALDLAAKGSSHIGGNAATNAGGLKLIRYGGTREQILGLEVVLANGDVLDMTTPLRKNNTGYDLKQIFIGAEGTLGIITKVTFKLTEKPRFFQCAILGVANFDNILNIMAAANQQGMQITAYEFFTNVAHEIVCKIQTQLSPLFSTVHPYYVLLEIESPSEKMDAFEEFLEGVIEKDYAQDAVVALDQRQFKMLWSYRELITESLAVYGAVYKNDISLPVGELGAFIHAIQPIIDQHGKDVTFVLFGHVGDGNIHINYLGSKEIAYSDFVKKAKIAEQEIFKVLKTFKGSVSAEHGIGLIKVNDLAFSRSDKEIALMKQIKLLFDPKNTFNPGKIFSVEEQRKY